MPIGAEIFQADADAAINGGGEGNTDPPRMNGKVRYCFTMHLMDRTIDQMIEECKGLVENLCKKYIFQVEQCPCTKNIHIQGYMVLKSRMRITQLNKIFKGCHFENCRGTEADNIKYCSKQESAVDGYGIYTKDIEAFRWKAVTLKLYTNLLPWQHEYFEIFKSNEYNIERHVIWIWEPIGKCGKTSFCKYLAARCGATVLQNGTSGDLRNLIFNTDMMIEDKTIVSNFSRCTEKINYQILEDIKDGIVCNLKYETGSKIFNSPHLVVFANAMPEIEKLSLDRWLIYEIKLNHLVKKSIF